MRQDNKKDIWDVLDLLQQRDPAWKEWRMINKFRILYFGWVAQELRHKIRTPQFFSVAWKRNWLNSNDFERFRRYAMQ